MGLQRWDQHPFLDEEESKGSSSCPSACCSAYDNNATNDEASCASHNHSSADDATRCANGNNNNAFVAAIGANGDDRCANGNSNSANGHHHHPALLRCAEHEAYAFKG